MKKTFKRTLIGSVVLIGLLASGGNSVFAEDASILTIFNKLYDVHGNEVRYNKEYYLEPAKGGTESQGIITEDWSDGKWAKLGPKSDAITVKLLDRSFRPQPTPTGDDYPVEYFKNSPLRVDLETNVMKNIRMPVGSNFGRTVYSLVPQSTYLSARSNGVEFALKDANHSTWVIYGKKQGDNFLMAFRDTNTGTFLSHRNSGEWLYANQLTINQDTMWKLIEK
ncbi:hypothetical protein [Bacillus cereus]|uniref:hypothetical protein n=1 Tax=Bacillus cereus TaxID=1396 RepID=UPI000BEDD6FF|nr:hypothetical protein [Bacillus cereus]PEE32647.1 hypothetical protein CON59_29905 [Bacillus cereus]PET51469.1 hypothetical protein CN523_03050 [Bacillus cereus]PEV85311.1 hypothetical protein CN429_06950 [Bacillus cereus]PFA60140.1 hypothetical protein CN389_02555 [Bacillus cereus]PFD68899.1 hypothetical protein CN271_19530 [Bacillus cereus]